MATTSGRLMPTENHIRTLCKRTGAKHYVHCVLYDADAAVLASTSAPASPAVAAAMKDAIGRSTVQTMKMSLDVARGAKKPKTRPR